MRKFYALVVLAGMMAGLWSGAAFASYWDEGNDGDSWETAYIIDSVEDFSDMRVRGDEEAGKFFKLATDLDIEIKSTGQSMWEYFGAHSDPFCGHFDGQNHTLTINLNSVHYPCSLFPTVSSDGIAIQNLNVRGSISHSSSWGRIGAGGIVGRLEAGIIDNCSFVGSVEAYNNVAVGSIVRAGGIVGSIEGEGTVRNCRFQGTVTASRDATGHAQYIIGYAGGIVAEIEGEAVIENCTVLSGSTIEADYAGGIVGDCNCGYIASITEGVYEIISSDDVSITCLVNPALLDSIVFPRISGCTSYAKIYTGYPLSGGIASEAPIMVGRYNESFFNNTWLSEYPEIAYIAYYSADVVIPQNPDQPVTPTSSNLSSHKYTVFNLGMTWTEAKAYCESLGGHLATISSQEEQNIIQGSRALKRQKFLLARRTTERIRRVVVD